MTDLEMVRKCAEAMGLEVVEIDGALYLPSGFEEGPRYDPLHDDAQAMALVKKCGLEIIPSVYGWDVWKSRCGGVSSHAEHKDLNRAIVECVANMQAAKEGREG